MCYGVFVSGFSFKPCMIVKMLFEGEEGNVSVVCKLYELFVLVNGKVLLCTSAN